MEDGIPRLVRAIRAARGLTQEKLAQELGVTFSTVNGWENGRHHPIPSLLRALQRMAAASGINRKATRPVRSGAAGRFSKGH